MSHVVSESNFLLFFKKSKSINSVLISCSSVVCKIASVGSCANLTRYLFLKEPVISLLNSSIAFNPLSPNPCVNDNGVCRGTFTTSKTVISPSLSFAIDLAILYIFAAERLSKTINTLYSFRNFGPCVKTNGALCSNSFFDV